MGSNSLGILNRFRAKPPGLRVAIFSTPKTGNAWLRSLLCKGYGLPDVHLRPDRSLRSFSDLGPSWVSHQHFFPSVELVGTLIREGITVLSTIRHPGDTLVSLFHFIQSSPTPPESPGSDLLLKDKGAIGAHTEEYARIHFPAVYSHSLVWAEIGAHVVRYEDLYADPFGQLRELAALLGPAPEENLRRAVLLCRPDIFRASRELDPRHIRAAKPQQWKSELPASIVEHLRSAEPIVEMSRRFGYDWDRDRVCAAFDYASIDPFRGARHFRNGVPIAPFMVRVLADDAPAAIREGADLTATGPGSFWEWLCLPSPLAGAEPALPGLLLTNLMAAIYRTRDDLRKRYPDIVRCDRFNFAWLFLCSCSAEYELPWEVVQPVQRALTGYLNKTFASA
jgi:hypothetical protein